MFVPARYFPCENAQDKSGNIGTGKENQVKSDKWLQMASLGPTRKRQMVTYGLSWSDIRGRQERQMGTYSPSWAISEATNGYIGALLVRHERPLRATNGYIWPLLGQHASDKWLHIWVRATSWIDAQCDLLSTSGRHHQNRCSHVVHLYVHKSISISICTDR